MLRRALKRDKEGYLGSLNGLTKCQILHPEAKTKESQRKIRIFSCVLVYTFFLYFLYCSMNCHFSYVCYFFTFFVNILILCENCVSHVFKVVFRFLDAKPCRIIMELWGKSFISVPET